MSGEIIKKLCTKCKVEKDSAEFSVDKTKIDGLYSQCKKCKGEINSRWHFKNQKKIKESKKARYCLHKVEILNKTRQRRLENPQLFSARSKQYYYKNHERNLIANRIKCSNRRTKLHGNLSKDLITKLFQLQRGKCACCSEPLGIDYHLDHIMPLALGGENEDCNMQLLKSTCNHQKHAKHPLKFMQERGFLL